MRAQNKSKEKRTILELIERRTASGGWEENGKIVNTPYSRGGLGIDHESFGPGSGAWRRARTIDGYIFAALLRLLELNGQGHLSKRMKEKREGIFSKYIDRDYPQKLTEKYKNDVAVKKMIVEAMQDYIALRDRTECYVWPGRSDFITELNKRKLSAESYENQFLKELEEAKLRHKNAKRFIDLHNEQRGQFERDFLIHGTGLTKTDEAQPKKARSL